jgi:hypothetical protein
MIRGEYASWDEGAIAFLSLQAAANEIEIAQEKPEHWLFAFVHLNRALTGALVRVLSGSAGIGAYPKEAQEEWLRYLDEGIDDPEAEMPKEGFVIRFSDLLKRARSRKSANDMQSPPLVLKASDRKRLQTLYRFRNGIDSVAR